MRVTPIIQHMRETLTAWNNRIDGAAEWHTAEDRSRLVIPCMFVMYGGSTAKILSRQAGLEQEMDERLRILVILDNTSDRTGKSAQDQVHLVREAIFSALLNYEADSDAHHLEFVGDSMVTEAMDKARYFHVFEFRQISTLTGIDDGIQTSLDNFDKFYTDWNLTEADETTYPNAQDQLDDLYEP